MYHSPVIPRWLSQVILLAVGSHRVNIKDEFKWVLLVQGDGS
jgi:hypothetical protein